MKTANFRESSACFDCDYNKNRLDYKNTEHIECALHKIPKHFIPMDWVCDDFTHVARLNKEAMKNGNDDN